MLHNLSFLLFLFSLSSCHPSKDSNNFEKDVIVQEIKLMLDAYHDDIKKEGLTAEFKYLDDSNDFFWVPPGYKSALSYDSVKVILQANDKIFKRIEFLWDTLQIFPLSNEFANYSGIVKGRLVDTSENIINVSIIESGTLIKRPDGWKLLNGQSANLPAEQ